METTQGDHPQVPPAKPPDQGDQPNEEVPVSGAHVLNEAMSEDTAAAKNGVSLPVKPASDSGGDHMGTPGGGPEVIAQDHVGAENHGPGETVPPPTPDRGSGMPPKSRNLDKQAKINEAMSAQRRYVCSTSPQQVLRIEGPGCPRNRGTSTNKRPKCQEATLTKE